MKDSLQIYLESVCVLQFWVKKQLSKEKKVVSIINPNSIKSSKQKFNFKQKTI